MRKKRNIQAAGWEQCKVICSAWASKHTYIMSFVDLCTHSSVWKCLVRIEESVLLRGFVQMVGAGRDCRRMGEVLHDTIGFAGASCKENMGRRGPMIFCQLCSLSAGGSCGLLLYSSLTRQWCSWSAHSQWFPCRRWWGWVEGDLFFSAGGESVGAVGASWRLTWCWWSRWGPRWCDNTEEMTLCYNVK